MRHNTGRKWGDSWGPIVVTSLMLALAGWNLPLPTRTTPPPRRRPSPPSVDQSHHLGRPVSGRPLPLGGQGTQEAAYRWAEPGLKTIVMTATNFGNSVSGTHTITIFAGDHKIYLPLIWKSNHATDQKIRKGVNNERSQDFSG